MAGRGRDPNLPALNVSNLDPDLYQRLRRYAFETGRTKKDIVEAALQEYMDRHPWEETVEGE